ncbi:hypothetical protein CKAH01_11351 [Colletotrichum kahawae]|uniref:Uncharacterized protein n=1 Tax=Colletotrichum kahawae TaxID=34407 RepID=A0AAE0DDT5_COLKA|nr:hypothetical protein CKAH01_11351 [Colletotrichum kahawae]
MYASHLPQRLLPDPDTTGLPRRERNRGILIPPPKSNPTRIDKQSTRFRHRPFSHDGSRRIGLHFFFFCCSRSFLYHRQQYFLRSDNSLVAIAFTHKNMRRILRSRLSFRLNFLDSPVVLV